MKALKRSRVRRLTHRMIASKYPTVGVFDDITSNADDQRAAFMLEALTNDRLAAQRISLLPNQEIITGPNGSGASIVMAAFLHADETGGRFTDNRLGGWYASFDVETAITETLYHNARRLRMSTAGFPNRIQIRELMVDIDDKFIDLRGLEKDRPELYRDADYSASQAFASEIRWPKSAPPENGVVFDSVRRQNGTNVCIFWPSKVTLPVVQGDHFEYQWDVVGKSTVVKLTNVTL